MVTVERAEGSSVEGGEGRKGSRGRASEGLGRGRWSQEVSRTTHLWMVTVEDGEGGGSQGRAIGASGGSAGVQEGEQGGCSAAISDVPATRWGRRVWPAQEAEAAHQSGLPI